MTVINDPFYLVREEIEMSVHSLHKKRNKLSSVEQERKALSMKTRMIGNNNTNTNDDTNEMTHEEREEREEIESERLSLMWQLDELDRATNQAEMNFERFKVPTKELEQRRKWTEECRRTLRDMMIGNNNNNNNNNRVEQQQQQSQSQSSRDGAVHKVKNVMENNRTAIDDYIVDERMQQDQLYARQNEELEDLSHHIRTIGNVGRTIGEELEQQGKMLEDLEEETEGVKARMQAANQMMIHVFKKAGVRAQMCTIFALSVILIVLFLIVLGEV